MSCTTSWSSLIYKKNPFHLLNSAHRIFLSWCGSCEEQHFSTILCAINSFLQVLVNESWGVLVLTQKSSHIITQFIDIWSLIYKLFFFLLKVWTKEVGKCLLYITWQKSCILDLKTVFLDYTEVINVIQKNVTKRMRYMWGGILTVQQRAFICKTKREIFLLPVLWEDKQEGDSLKVAF